MVIWLFAGGGPPEYSGLVKLLQKEFPKYHFERQLPQLAHKPIGKPNRIVPIVRSTTGSDLLRAISERLSFLLTRKSLEERLLKNSLCDAILVIDDLDCRRWEGLVCNDIKSPGFHQIQNNYIQQVTRSLIQAKEPLDERMKNRLDELEFNPQIIVGFASPEIESWIIIADWGNCHHRDFPQDQWDRMRRWLGHKDRAQAQVDFKNPELYGGFNAQKGVCQVKRSEQIVEASTQAQISEGVPQLSRYNKARHSSDLLEKISCQKVQEICPLFKTMYQSLQRLGT